MKQIAAVLAGILVAGAAGAGDVYVTKDAQGHTIYTDTPLTIPAQKLDIHDSTPSSAADAQSAAPATQRLSQQDQSASGNEAVQAANQQAAQTTAEDRAKRCTDARQRYQSLMENWRIYEAGPNGERTYLTSEQIDQARANAKQVMDQFCADQ